MTRKIAIAVIAWTATAALHAEDSVGIRFAEMPLGTTLVTERYGRSGERQQQKFLGRRGDEYVMESGIYESDGSLKHKSEVFYDLEGRKLRLERNGAQSSYAPFNCEYVIGECEHEYSYPWTFDKGARTMTGSARYQTRREGNTLVVGRYKSDGTLADRPFELGEYNLRVSSTSVNVTGSTVGFKLIELSVPDE